MTCECNNYIIASINRTQVVTKQKRCKNRFGKITRYTEKEKQSQDSSNSELGKITINTEL